MSRNMAISHRPSTRISGCFAVVVPHGLAVLGILPIGSVKVVFAGCLDGEFHIILGLGGAASGVSHGETQGKTLKA